MNLPRPCAPANADTRQTRDAVIKIFGPAGYRLWQYVRFHHSA